MKNSLSIINESAQKFQSKCLARRGDSNFVISSHDHTLRSQIVTARSMSHFVASLKDLGKKWFAVSKMTVDSFEFLEKLK